MKNLFKATTRTGKTYNVRLIPIEEKLSPVLLGQEGNWRKRAEMEVNGKWYVCEAKHNYDKDGKMLKVVEINEYNTELQDALNLPAKLRKLNNVIMCEDWHPIYLEMQNEFLKETKAKANAVKFSKVNFTYHTSLKWCAFRWDADSEDIKYNDKIDAFKDALKNIEKEMLDNFKIGTHYDDYSNEYYYEINADDIDRIIKYSLPGLEKAKEKRLKSEIAEQKRAEKKKNIENGSVYFHCESQPHNEDNKGLFVLEHQISEEHFSQIEPFGNYWDKEWLEDCDMFYSEPGWRFTIDAVLELSKNNDVYVDNELFNKK